MDINSSHFILFFIILLLLFIYDYFGEKMELNSLLIEENDDLQDLFSKYGALALEKQEILSSIVGNAEPELDIEKGIVRFGEKMLNLNWILKKELSDLVKRNSQFN